MDNESNKLISWFKIAAGIFLFIGIAFSLGIWIDYSKIKEVQEWPVTDGHIVVHYKKSSSMGQTNQLIKYQYFVEGQKFESSKVNPNQFTQGKENFFSVKKDNKTTVFVHYNREIPSESYLVIEWDPFKSTHFYYALSSIFFGAIFSIILIVLKVKQNQVQKTELNSSS